MRSPRIHIRYANHATETLDLFADEEAKELFSHNQSSIEVETDDLSIDQVKEAAKTSCLKLDYDPIPEYNLYSQLRLSQGPYAGQKLLWVVQHDMGYTIRTLGEVGKFMNSSHINCILHIALCRFALSHEPIHAFHHDLVHDPGNGFVGYGPFYQLRRKELLTSKQQEHIEYVSKITTTKKAKRSTLEDVLVEYLLHPTKERNCGCEQLPRLLRPESENVCIDTFHL